MVSLPHYRIDQMLLTYCYRLLPSKRQHLALDRILEDQRQLYNAALEERIGAYRNAGISRTYFCRAQHPEPGRSGSGPA